MFANADRNILRAQTIGDDKASSSLKDGNLWQSFRDGNDLAFSILYKKYVPPLYNYGMHACRDHDLVMDCLQELFTRLWDKRTKLSAVEGVRFYLFKSFRRYLFARLAQKRKFSIRLLRNDDRAFEMLAPWEDALIGEEISAERSVHLKKALQQLTRRQREVIFLKFFNELSYPEVATIMELSLDSVYNLVTKAIDALRKCMKRACLITLPLFAWLAI